MNTIKQRRQALNISQQKLADEAKMERSRLCRVERGEFQARPEEAVLIARALKCRLEDLQLDLELPPPYTEEAREFLKRFRKSPSYEYKHDRPIESRFPVMRDHYGIDVKALRADPHMDRFLHRAYFDSAMEPSFWSERHRLEKALPVEAAPQLVGFDLHPVVSPQKPHRVIGHCPVPAMATARWLAILQVGVLTPRYFRMDALIVTFHGGRRIFVVLELDGPSKPPPCAVRERMIGLSVIRFSKEEILRGVSINEKLDELFG